ncbi:unnamed protein product [Ectocarpus sp. CCAP 1310/34]|nr:unnamed protein product [Ectocarpus sp. CCAP 1310/34]
MPLVRDATSASPAALSLATGRGLSVNGRGLSSTKRIGGPGFLRLGLARRSGLGGSSWVSSVHSSSLSVSAWQSEGWNSDAESSRSDSCESAG